MKKHYQSLPLLLLNEDNHYSHPPVLPELVYLEDPALDVLINFETQQPAITHPKTHINIAKFDMKVHGSHIMLVVEDDVVVGAISSEDILGEKPMQIVQERRIKYDEILVRAIMTPREKLATIRYQDLSHAKVGHVLATLNEAAQHYLIVVDSEDSSSHQTVHGIIYLYDILKRLDHNSIMNLREANSLLELEKYMK